MSDKDSIDGSKAVKNGSLGVPGMLSSEANGTNGVIQNGSSVKSSDNGVTAKKSKRDSHLTVTPEKSIGSPFSDISAHSSEFDFVECEPIDETKIAQVMKCLRTHHFSPVTAKVEDVGISGNCAALFKRDYAVVAVDNAGGCLSYNYPAELLIPISRNNDSEGSRTGFDTEKYIKQVKSAFTARCRARFLVPVMLCEKNFICRSGTLTVLISSAYESVVQQPEIEKERYVEEEGYLQSGQRLVSDFVSAALLKTKALYEATAKFVDPEAMNKLLQDDVEILKHLKVSHICDLMVENCKKAVKGILCVGSSEKSNLDFYGDFKIEQMPYPGCEFFEMYHEAERKPKGLVFNWDEPDVDAKLEFSEDPSKIFPDIHWDNYKEWDVVELTKNYMKMLLYYVAKGDGGLDVHCISGWDRTPLFISLLRISLWADGIIHESVSMMEITYLTLAYDWYHFGHNFPTRFRKREEIMHFCFNFLGYMSGEEFSATKMFQSLPPEEKLNRKFPEYKPGRRGVISDISKLLLKTYEEQILTEAEAMHVDE